MHVSQSKVFHKQQSILLFSELLVHWKRQFKQKILLKKVGEDVKILEQVKGLTEIQSVQKILCYSRIN